MVGSNQILVADGVEYEIFLPQLRVDCLSQCFGLAFITCHQVSKFVFNICGCNYFSCYFKGYLMTWVLCMIYR